MTRTSLLEKGHQEFPGNNFTLIMLGSQADVKTIDNLPDFFVRISNIVTAEDVHQPFLLKINKTAIEKLNKDIVGEQLGKALQAAIDWAAEELGETDNWRLASSQQPYGHEVTRSYEHVRTEIGCSMLQLALSNNGAQMFGNRASFNVTPEREHTITFMVSDNIHFHSFASNHYGVMTTEASFKISNQGNYIGRVRIYQKEYFFSVRAQINRVSRQGLDLFGSGRQPGMNDHLAAYDLDSEVFINSIQLASMRELPFLTREIFEIVSVEKVPLNRPDASIGFPNPYESL